MSKKSKARKSVRANHKVCWNSTHYGAYNDSTNTTNSSFSNYTLEELSVMPTDELVKMLAVADNGLYTDFSQPFKLMCTAFDLAEAYNAVLLKFFIAASKESVSDTSITIDMRKFSAFKQEFTVDGNTNKEIRRILFQASITAKRLDVMMKTTLPKIFNRKKDMRLEDYEMIYTCLNDAKSALVETFPNMFDEQGNVID